MELGRRPRIVILGGKPARLEKARLAGFDVVWIHSLTEVDVGGLAQAAQVHLMDFRIPEAVTEVVRASHRITPVDRVVALTEDAMVPAAHAGSALGLPGNSLETVQLLQDKLAFRAVLRERGVDDVAARQGGSEAEIAAFVAAHGPAVIKPRGGVASLGVRLVHSQADVPDAWRGACDFGMVPFLMEEYLEGPELSVETFSFAGRHVVLAQTAKQTHESFVEIGHTQPASLDPATVTQVNGLVTRMLDTVGFRDGPAHTEVKLTPAGPHLVESHSRRGGDRIADLVQHVYGIDIDALAFRWYAGKTGPVVPGPPRCGAAVHFLTAAPGIVEAIENVEEVRADPGLVDLELDVSPGDRVYPLYCSDDRVGLVLATGPSGPAAQATAAALAARLTIRTRPEPDGQPPRTLAWYTPHPERMLGTDGMPPPEKVAG